MKLSTGLRNFMLDSGSFVGALGGGVIKIYEGNVPDTADAVVPTQATELVEITVDGNANAGLGFEASANDGTILKDTAQNWEGTVANAGTANWFRFVKQNDDGSQSQTAIRLQGTVGQGSADMNLSSLSLSSGAVQTVDFLSVSLPV